MAGLSVGNRVLNLKHRIAVACAAAHRDPGSVNLIAVSKLQDVAKIRAAYASGQRDFAENYWQEASAKQEQLKDLSDIRWHFIGRIQANKAKHLPGKFFAIHSLDRVSVASELERVCAQKNLRQNVFMQINVAGENSKGGALQADVLPLWDCLRQCSHLRVLGLMVMPPLAAEGRASRGYFARGREILHELVKSLPAGSPPLLELSMGTSQDFSEAIAEGATWIRVGSELFGARAGEKQEDQQ